MDIKSLFGLGRNDIQFTEDMSLEDRMLMYLDKKICTIECEINNINRGGCAVFANILGTKLDEIGIPYEIAFLYTGDVEHLENNRNNTLGDLLDVGFSLKHVMIKIHGKYVDSEGIVDHYLEIENWSECTEVIADKEMLDHFAGHPNGWNQMFDRSDIYQMHGFMDSFFNKFNRINSQY